MRLLRFVRSWLVLGSVALLLGLPQPARALSGRADCAEAGFGLAHHRPGTKGAHEHGETQALLGTGKWGPLSENRHLYVLEASDERDGVRLGVYRSARTNRGRTA
ncbi:MAG: hypothetical protein FJ091_07375 [Deltaproteobacteria bacterium]|nr:hypothetical protein [Deltaproteobacteria bacterium]